LYQRAPPDARCVSARQLSEDGDRGLIREVNTTSHCRLRPVDGFSLCAGTSADTRMRQPVDHPPTFSSISTDSSCANSGGTDPSLWGQPLHTRIKIAERTNELVSSPANPPSNDW